MCANCVSRFDMIAGSVGLAAFAFKEPLRNALVDVGVLPEPHALAIETRTVVFLRDLDLDPGAILGADVVTQVDRVLSFERDTVYRRRWRDAFAFMRGRHVLPQHAGDGVHER